MGSVRLGFADYVSILGIACIRPIHRRGKYRLEGLTPSETGSAGAGTAGTAYGPRLRLSASCCKLWGRAQVLASYLVQEYGFEII